MTQPIDYAAPGLQQPRRFATRWWGWIFFVGVAALLFVWLKQAPSGPRIVPLSQFLPLASGGKFSVITVSGDELVGQLRTPTTVGAVTTTRIRTELPAGTGGHWTFTQWLLANSGGATVQAEPSNDLLTNFILPFIPWLLILAFIWFFVFRRMNALRPAQPVRVVVVDPEVR